MKHFITILTTVFFLSLAQAQIDSTGQSVQAIFYGQKGDVQNYKVTYNTLKMKGSDTLSNETIHYLAALTVLDADDKSYTLEWKINQYHFQTPIPVLKALSEFNNNLTIVYSTNELGEYRDVLNYPAIKEKLEQYTKEVKSKLTPDEQQFFETTIQNILGTKEAFTRNTIQDILQIHNFYGIKYSSQDTIALDVKIPNNFDASLTDAKFISYINELGKDTYTLVSVQAIEPQVIDQAAKQYLRKVFPPESQQEIDNYDLSHLQQITTLVNQIHNSGWPLMSVNSKINTSLTQYKRDTRIIEIQPK